MAEARGDDRVRIRFEEKEERSSEGRDLFLDFVLEAGMLDEVDDEVRELLGARFCQARAAALKQIKRSLWCAVGLA